jgi:hypothetical protein
VVNAAWKHFLVYGLVEDWTENEGKGVNSVVLSWSPDAERWRPAQPRSAAAFVQSNSNTAVA